MSLFVCYEIMHACQTPSIIYYTLTHTLLSALHNIPPCPPKQCGDDKKCINGWIGQTTKICTKCCSWLASKWRHFTSKGDDEHVKFFKIETFTTEQSQVPFPFRELSITRGDLLDAQYILTDVDVSLKAIMGLLPCFCSQICIDGYMDGWMGEDCVGSHYARDLDEKSN